MSYERIKKHRINRKEKLVQCLGGQCVKCGYNRCLSALDFHHIDPTTKSFSISQTLNKKLSLVIEEIKKCVLLCSNCHRELHSDLWSLDEVNIPKFVDFITPAINNNKVECPYCGVEFFKKRKTKYCSQQCRRWASRKCKRPSKEKLKKQIEKFGYVGTGKIYGVSDNAIRKWLI